MSERTVPAGVPRLAVVLCFLLVAVWSHYMGGPLFGAGLLLCFLLAVGIGLAWPAPWSLPLAALPWPVGVGAGLITGRYLFLGEFWQLVWLISALTGLLGIAVGIALGRPVKIVGAVSQRHRR